jgi:hypothetical protein
VQAFLKAVSENPLVPLGGILLGVLGIILAVVFFIRSRRVSKVRYDCSGRSLVEGLSGALEGIEVRYKGSPQERITVSRLVFWNAGTETIRVGDFTDDPLRIVCTKDVAILDHRIVEPNDATNKIWVGSVQHAEDETFITIRFDYLDANDGAIVQIVHNGSERVRFRLAGSLKGNCSITRSESPTYRMQRIYQAVPIVGELTKSSLFGWFGALTYFVGGIAALIAPFRGASWWFLALAAFCFFAMWVMIYSYATGQVPSHFRRELGKLPTANKPSEATSQ